MPFLRGFVLTASFIVLSMQKDTAPEAMMYAYTIAFLVLE
jgi:hypothetical protein